MTTTSPPQHGVTPVKHEASPRSREGRRFPGWRWVAVWLAFPVAGYIGWIVGGRVDAVGAALIGGALTGAGIGAVQWWAADGALGRPAGWIVASAVGLTAGAALVGYDTDLGSLALMGLVSGAALGAAQGFVLAREGPRGLALPWGLAMPLATDLCASATSTARRSTSSRTVRGGEPAQPRGTDRSPSPALPRRPRARVPAALASAEPASERRAAIALQPWGASSASGRPDLATTPPRCSRTSADSHADRGVARIRTRNRTRPRRGREDRVCVGAAIPGVSQEHATALRDGDRFVARST